jgi:hypothetical protein
MKMNDFLSRLKYMIAVVGAYLVLDLRLYYLWSRLGRWLFQREYVDRPICKYRNAEELQKFISTCTWTQDTWWELGDMISAPAFFEVTKKGDCDDFSVYIGQVLQELHDKSIQDVSLLTIPWIDANGNPGGHNVCVFRRQKGSKLVWAWSSNWYDGVIQWTDFEDINDIVRSVVGQFYAVCTRWARVSIDLKHVFETGGGVYKYAPQWYDKSLK